MSSTLDPSNLRRWALAHFAGVWRTSADQSGYAVLAASDPQPTSKELRRAMMDLMAAFAELSPVPFVVERVGRFDQQVSTRFHRDGAADVSLLLLGYEPTTVESKLFLHDPLRAAGSGGSAFHYLKDNKPMTKEGDAELTRHAVNVLGPPGQARIVVVNNCTVLENPSPGHPLGVLHRGLIEFPDPNVRRVINSMGLMYEGEPHREPVSAERMAWFLHGDTTE
jgi:hypothetical protein